VAPDKTPTMPAQTLRRDGRDWLLDVRVTPRASRTRFAGVVNGRLRVQLQAPPVDGRANAALIEHVAKCCGVPKSSVSLERGDAARDKTLRLRGLADVPAALQAALAIGTG
jgi:uncharacterized protein (TIGR00251 family)